MTNYCHQYIRDDSTISAPLRLLTKKNQPFIWKQAQQDAFEKLKSSLNSQVIMAIYSSNIITHLVDDTSPVGLGAILTQQQADGLLRPIAFASRSTRCRIQVQPDRMRSFSGFMGFQHFHHYVFYRHIINTDHKPLEILLSHNSNPPPHIQS